MEDFFFSVDKECAEAQYNNAVEFFELIKIFGGKFMMNFDDIEKLFEGVLAGLKARKEIEPLREKNSELENKVSELEVELQEKNFNAEKLFAELAEVKKNLADLQNKFDNAEKNFEEREKNLRTKFENEIADLKKNLADKDKNISNLQEKLSDAEETAKFYSESYSELDEVYKLYLTLDNDTRYNLAGIFGDGETAAGFFSGAVQENHLAQFWDYVSRHLDTPESEILCRLFDFCFDTLNKGSREPIYSRLNVACGNNYDDDSMQRTQNSPQFGTVKKILLQGFKYRVGNTVKPSVVELI